MSIYDLLPDGPKLLISFVGSLIALNWLPGNCWRKTRMLAAGTALSYTVAAPLAGWAGMNEGATGLILGLLGMALVDKIFESIAKVQAADLFTEWLRKVLGLPAKSSGD